MGYRYGIGIRTAAVVLAMAGAGSAQAPAWEKINLPDGAVWTDPDWGSGGFGWGPAGTLATDRGGRLYVNNGTRLHIGAPGGGSWRTVNKPLRPGWNLTQKRALGAGSESTVFWGDLASKDGGVTWDSVGDVPGGSFSTAILDDGTALAAVSLDGIQRAVAPWKKWETVHRGETFGHVRSFHHTASGPVFALPLSAGMLRSWDQGKTWQDLTAQDQLRLSTYSIRALDFEGPSGTPLWMVGSKDDRTRGNVLLRLSVFFHQLDTLKTTVLPDSPATALQVTMDGAIWVSFNGQGVRVSRDQGRTFTASNQGLESLFVEALEMTSDGTLYAFARNGLYRLRAASAIRPRAGGFRPDASSRYGLHLAGLPTDLQPAAANLPIRIQADGRFLITPARP